MPQRRGRSSCLQGPVRRVPRFAALILLVCLPRAAWAEGDTERARALFDEAGALERQGQWGAAQEKLRAALRLRETPQLYYALGWALENDDKLLEAKTEYETAIRLGTNKPNAEEAVRLATARLLDLERKTPVIKVRIAGRGASTARLFVDGRETRRSSGADAREEATLVNPGSHVVRVERGAAPEATEQMVYVSRGSVKIVDVDAGETEAARDSAQERHAPSLRMGRAADERDKRDVVLPWVLVGGGLAFVAGGSALLFSSSSDSDRRDDLRDRWCTSTACQNGTATIPESPEATSYRQQSEEAADRGNTKQAIGFVLGGVGLVSATVGAVLLLRDAPSSKDKVHASATWLPGGGAAQATFQF